MATSSKDLPLLCPTATPTWRPAKLAISNFIGEPQFKGHLSHIYGGLKWGDPQVTMGFNAKSWSAYG